MMSTRVPLASLPTTDAVVDGPDRTVRDAEAVLTRPGAASLCPATSNDENAPWVVPVAGGYSQQPTDAMPVALRARHAARRWERVGSVFAAAFLLVAGFVAATMVHGDDAQVAVAGEPRLSQPSTPAAASPSGARPNASASASRGPRTIGSVNCPRPGETVVRSWKSSSVPGAALEFRDAAALPLCGQVKAGALARKGFTLKNTGATRIEGWTLHLIAATGTCLRDADREGAIIPLAPGATFSASLEFTAPDRPGECSAEFEIRDSSGRAVFADGFTVPFAVAVVN